MAVTDGMRLNAAAIELLCTVKSPFRQNWTGKRLKKMRGVKMKLPS